MVGHLSCPPVVRILELLLVPFFVAFLGCKAPCEHEEATAVIMALEKENALLWGEVSTLQQRLAALLDGTKTVHTIVCPVFPLIDAKVLEVDEATKRVVLDKGERDGVRPGFEFTVFLGSTYKGYVRIQDVQEATSSGSILGMANPIAKGDSATTQL